MWLLIQAKPSTIAKLSSAAIGLAIVAAGLAIYSVFQPAFEVGDSDFGVAGGNPEVLGANTLIQKGSGWVILACAIGIVGFACLSRVFQKRATVWGMLIAVFGLGIFAATVHQVTGGRDGIEVGNDLLMLVHLFHATPALGLRAAKWAAGLAVVAGLTLAYMGVLADEPQRQRRAKPLKLPMTHE